MAADEVQTPITDISDISRGKEIGPLISKRYVDEPDTP